MDARITKQRLGNLISYDWLKILATIVAFILVLILLFTTTATRPKSWQEYYVYAYTDVSTDADFSSLGTTLLERDVFSYDILSVASEGFSGNNYAASVYSARRAAGQGTVMFITNDRVYKTDEDGEIVYEEGEPVIETESQLYSFTGGTAYSGPGTPTSVYDTVYYMQLCEEYLADFFGDDWEESDALDGETTPEESFARRNDGDKRYRTDEARAQGIADERERLLKLREDYLVVKAAFEAETLVHTSYTTEEEGGSKTAYIGIDVGGLNGLKELVYYTNAAGERATRGINLMILYNNYLDGNDLNFETVSFLRYLLENYA